MSPLHGRLVVTSDMARIAHLTRAQRIELPPTASVKNAGAMAGLRTHFLLEERLLPIGIATSPGKSCEACRHSRPKTQKGVSLAGAS